MGLNVYTYRNPLGDCTMGGISSTAKGLCLVNVDGPFEPSSDYLPAMLVGNGAGDVRVVPAYRDQGEWKQIPLWWMFGGNFASTSDSRFTQAIRTLTGSPWYGAVPIHDRTETAEQSAFLSR